MTTAGSKNRCANPEPPRLVSFLSEKGHSPLPELAGTRPLIGVVEGVGIGPQMIEAALVVLTKVGQAQNLEFEVRHSGGTDEKLVSSCGEDLPEGVATFCAEIFGRGGAILHGPVGGRYVYNLRRHFDLFCKFIPVCPVPELARAGRIAPQFLRDVDILIVRDNTGGVYQGRWGSCVSNGRRVAEHSFHYAEPEVHRLVDVAARAAATRRGCLHIIVKDGGVPAITALWRDVSLAEATQRGVEVKFVNIDLAAYELIQNPTRFDVIATPNLFGDVMADLAGVLVASRGLTFSGNFDAQAHGVYQTNHGCAHDLAGTNTANPAGQILSLAMLLRESFGLAEAAALIEQSLADVWRQGWRTPDLAEPDCKIVGTDEMAAKVAEQVLRTAESNRAQ